MARVKKKTHLKKSAKRICCFGIIACVSIFAILLSVFKVVAQIVDKYQEANNLEMQLANLKKEEKNLNDEILKLQDPEYLARYAREKYFYSKDGELIIRIPNK